MAGINKSVVLFVCLTFIPLTLTGQVKVKKASSSATHPPEALRQDLIASKKSIDQAIAPWQKKKLANVTDMLGKTTIAVSSGDNPVDKVKKEVKNVFHNLTDKQTDFFTVYILGSLSSTGSQTPDWMQNTLQKQQQLIQMLSNVSKMLNDETQSNIRKIGCSGSECED